MKEVLIPGDTVPADISADISADIPCFHDYDQELAFSLLYYLVIRRKITKSDEANSTKRTFFLL